MMTQRSSAVICKLKGCTDPSLPDDDDDADQQRQKTGWLVRNVTWLLLIGSFESTLGQWSVYSNELCMLREGILYVI
jgi:hypothetical protein